MVHYWSTQYSSYGLYPSCDDSVRTGTSARVGNSVCAVASEQTGDAICAGDTVREGCTVRTCSLARA